MIDREKQKLKLLKRTNEDILLKKKRNLEDEKKSLEEIEKAIEIKKGENK